MLIVLLFIVLLALKLAAIGIVYTTNALVPLAIIAALIALAYRLEPSVAKPARPAPRSPESET